MSLLAVMLTRRCVQPGNPTFAVCARLVATGGEFSMQHTTMIERTAILAVCILCFSAHGHGQFSLPAGAQVDLFFPHFADGGSPSQDWQTSVFFVNPLPFQVTGQLSFFGQGGQPISVDFGTGSFSNFTLTIPANG